MAETAGKLEANALDADGAVGFSRTAGLFGGESEAELFDSGTISRDGGALKEAFERSLAGFGVEPSLVLHLQPGLGRLVQKRKAQLRDSLQHGDESTFDLGEEHLLLAVLVRAVGKRGFVNDTEAGKALFDFIGSHRRAVVGEKSPWKSALHEGLTLSVDEFLSGFFSIPLQVTTEPRAVIEHGHELGLEPFALGAEEFARAVVVVQVPKRVHVFGFEAADFPSFERFVAIRRGRRSLRSAVAASTTLFLEQAVLFHETADGGVGRQGSLLWLLVESRREVVVMKLVTGT